MRKIAAGILKVMAQLHLTTIQLGVVNKLVPQSNMRSVLTYLESGAMPCLLSPHKLFF